MTTAIATLDSFTRYPAPKLIDRLNAGVKASVLSELAKILDLPRSSLAGSIGLSPRTLRTRKVLNADETERAYRVYRVYVRAREVLENADGARDWLLTPQRALGERTPLAMLERDVGVQEVLNLLNAIEDGGYL